MTNLDQPHGPSATRYGRPKAWQRFRAGVGAVVLMLTMAPSTQAHLVAPGTAAASIDHTAPRQLTPVLRLQLLAAAARAATMDGSDTAFTQLSSGADDPQAFLQALSRFQRASFDLVLAQSVQYACVQDDVGVVGWFDPFTRSWIVTEWAKSGVNWRVTQLGVTTAEALEPADPTRPWYRQAPTLLDSLRKEADDAQRQFRGLIATGPGRAKALDRASSTAAMQVIVDRVRSDGELMAKVERQPAYRHFVRPMTKVFLTATDAIVDDAKSKRSIDALSGAERITLRPAAVFQRAEGQTFLIQSPLAPARIFVLHYARPGPNDDAQPVRIQTLDFLNGAQQ